MITLSVQLCEGVQHRACLHWPVKWAFQMLLPSASRMAGQVTSGRGAGQAALLREVVGQHRTTLFQGSTAPCAPCAGMLEKLCLAQAQECVFEKARTDKKSPAILARSVPRQGSRLHSST